MIRRLDQLTAVPVLIFGPWLLFIIVLVAGVLIGLGWHFWPRWVPRRGWWSAVTGVHRSESRHRHRRAGQPTDPEVEAIDADERLPDRSVAEFLSLADRYAAEGRFREAIRERLRAIVRALVDRHVIDHHPEWTVTELVVGAARVVPTMRTPLEEASRIFTDVWYGERPADQARDDRMRDLAGQVETLLAALAPAVAGIVGAAPVVIG